MQSRDRRTTASASALRIQVSARKRAGRRALKSAPSADFPVFMRVFEPFRFLSGSATRFALADSHGASGGGSVVRGALAGRDLDLVGAALEAAAALLGGREHDCHDAVGADLAHHPGDDVA